ncbi:MAG: TlpA disulfide reductase family protein [Eubacteriales bacterium]
MKKAVSVLILLCLLTGIFGLVAAEGSPKVLDFPKSGFAFTVPDYIENMEGAIYSISDYGETSIKSGIINACLVYLPRTTEEINAMKKQMEGQPADNANSEEFRAVYTEFVAPRTELFILIGLAEGKTWETDVLSMNGAEALKDPVKIGDCDGFTYYLTTLKPEMIRTRMEQVGPDLREAFIDATNRLMEQPELFTLKERDKSDQPPEPGTQIDFEATDLDGNPVTRADLTAGSKVTMITFWQTFCGPCKDEMPELDRLVREYGSKGLNVVGCVCDAVTESTLATAKEINGEHLFRNVKATKSVDQALPARGTPTTYFLDGEGKVLDYPIASVLPEDYIAALEDYLNGKTDTFQALLKQKVDGVETPAQTDEEQIYTVFFVDQNGEPVPEVMAAFCTAERCHNVTSDEEGKVVYKGPANTYHVTIVEVPDGYSEDYNDDVFTEKHSCSITIVIDKE